MTPEFLTAPFAQALGWALLHLFWQAAIVAAILAVALVLLRDQSATMRYGASCAALALLPVLAIATAWRCYNPWTAPESLKPIRAELLPIDLARAAVAHATTTTMMSLGDIVRAMLPQIVLLWLAGVTLLSIRLLVSWSRVQRLAATASPASEQWEAALDRIVSALALDRAVSLLESAAIEVPTVIGWLRPAILLPASTLSGLSPEQIEMLLSHELAHIRRNDFAVNLLQSVVETLMFYHPAVWWISGRIRAERENCCDDLAVEISGSAVRYARALTRLEELRSARMGLAIGANGGSLISRIRRLVDSPADVSSSAPRWIAAVGVLAVVVAVLSVPTLPAHAEKNPQTAPAATATKAASSPARTEINVTPETNDTESADDDADAENITSSDEDDATKDAAAVEGGVAGGIEGGVAGGVAGGVVAPVALARPAIVPMGQAAPVVVVNPSPAAVAVVAPAVRVGFPVLAQVAPEAAAAPEAPEHHSRREFGENGKLTVDELIALRNAGVTPEYIAEMRSAGLGQVSLREIMELGTQGVRPEYLREMRGAGLVIDNARDALTLRVAGVTPDYIRQLRDAGYHNLTSRNYAELRMMGVTPALIKALADAGYSNLSARELSRLAASGVNADFIRQMSQYRDKK